MSFGFQDYKELVKIVSLVSVVLILGWIVFTLRASKEYRGWIIKNLLPSEPRPDKSVAGLDMDYVKLIIDTLESKDRSPNLYAMNLFELMQKGKLTPELMQLLSEEPEITAPKSLGAFFDSDPTALLQMNEVREDEDVLQKEIKKIMTLDVYEEVMIEYCEKIISGKISDAETAKMEIAKAIGFMSVDSPMVDKLEELIMDDSSEVRKLAIESISKIRRKEHVPALIQSLEDIRTRSDSSTALEKYGSKITGMLADYLGDTDEKAQLRKAVIPILAHIGNQEAADFILLELDIDNREMDTELIDALDRIRSETPSIKFSVQTVKKKIRMEIMSYYDLFVEFVDAESKGQEPKICGILSHQLNVCMMNIFKLLGLIYPHEEIVKAFQNIQAGTKKSVAYAVEALDNTLEKEMREAVLPIVEDLSLDEKVKACLALRKEFPEI
jgi:HEAT repeat protein